jgi:hypothetical protein
VSLFQALVKMLPDEKFDVSSRGSYGPSKFCNQCIKPIYQPMY